MLVKENNNIVFLIVTLILFGSCKRENKSSSFVEKRFNSYSEIHKIITDSVSIYVGALLKEYLNIYDQEWQIDSMICIHSNGTKLVATINNSSGTGEYAVSDEITKLLGKKINGRWYFFQGGGTLIVPRDLYGKDAMHPLSFYELSRIGRKEFLESALIKNEAGEWIVSDKWVLSHFEYSGMCACKTHEQYDSTHWAKITGKWKHRIDTLRYKRRVKAGPAQ